jgi:hypothetical protein
LGGGSGVWAAAGCERKRMRRRKVEIRKARVIFLIDRDR